MTAGKQRAAGSGQRAENAALASASHAQSSVDGLALGEEATARSGEDARRRGWFWHWNSIVTQYAPLLGLKGVGLLNSYTVWTDRREESPHRGYAFPSQQSEADFYGEDRAELIAINKILVALDLIEIRKEMVLRTDPQGRRWRVPHNFYRVKDHADGFALSGRDVLRVAELADRDKAVYRHVRRVFSPRFAPIDGDNVWHRILPELRRTELWQRLATRAAAEEDRASARTRAGHAARRAAGAGEQRPDDAPRAPFFAPTGGDGAAPETTANDTGDVGTDEVGGTSVATFNNGSEVDVADANRGSTASATTSVGSTNVGWPTAVEPSNTTYHQPSVTTTTTVGLNESTEEHAGPDGPGGTPTVAAGTTPPDIGAGLSMGVDDAEPALADAANRDDAKGMGAAGPAARAPGDAPGEAAAIRAFEAANARPATPAERTLLRGLAERFASAAEAAAAGTPSAPGSGWGWLAAAAYEAVEAGSAFVAPRRLREIMTRWERDGFPQAEEGAALGPASRATGGVGAGATRRAGGGASARQGPPDPTAVLGVGPDLDLPHGHGARQTWAFAVGLLTGAIEPAALAELVAGSAIVGYRDGEVTIAVPDAVRAERLATTHRELVARKLSEAMRRPVRLAVLTAGDGGRRAEGREGAGGERGPVQVERGSRRGASAASGGARGWAPSAPPRAVPAARSAPLAGDDELAPVVPVDFPIAECGLPSGQVWAAVLAEAAAGGEVSSANFDAWLRPTALVGRGGDGGAGSTLLVAAPHALAQRRVAARFLPALRAAVAAVVGVPLPVEVVVAGHPPAGAAGEGDDESFPRAAGA